MRKIATLAVAIAATAAMTTGIAACGADSTAATPTQGQSAASVNDVQDQNETATITGYNTAMHNPDNRYPGQSMANSLELKMLRERDLFLNDSTKTMYIYIFPSGRNEVFFSTVRGKVSSMASEMTATHGIYKDANGYQSGGGGNVSIDIPQDDLSYGGTEFGDNGIFWFDEQGGFHEAGTAGATVMIESMPLKLSAIELPAQAMPADFLAKLKTAK